MKKVHRFEILGILSLSLMLTSTFAISSCLPEMMKTFHEYERSEVEFLVSSTTFSVILMIALTPILSQYLSERFMVVSGLLIYGICGTAPFFIQSYPFILASRILMGVGVGMVNAKAVSMIGERFSGDLRSKLLGIRCSTETLGQTVLMLIVGQLLPLGWNYAFVIYSAAFLILIIYLVFVPTYVEGSSELRSTASGSGKVRGSGQTCASDKACSSGNAGKSKSKIRKSDRTVILFHVFMGFTLVSASSLNTLRITTYIVDSGIGNASDGATILSAAVFFGFLGGLVFGKLMEKLRNLILPLVLLGVAVGMAAIGFADNLVPVAFGACICNFCITLGTSYMFNGLSEQLSPEALGTGNSIVLVGCNLGSFTISFVLQAINLISPALTTGFFFYAILYLILAVVFLLAQKKTTPVQS